MPLIISEENSENETKEIEAYERIAQLVITPYIKACFNEVNDLNVLRRIREDYKDDDRIASWWIRKDSEGS